MNRQMAEIRVVNGRLYKIVKGHQILISKEPSFTPGVSHKGEPYKTERLIEEVEPRTPIIDFAVTVIANELEAQREVEAAVRKREELVAEEERILRILYSANKPLSTLKISRQTEMAWNTAKKYLDQLHKKGAVQTMELGKTLYWWIRT